MCDENYNKNEMDCVLALSDGNKKGEMRYMAGFIVQQPNGRYCRFSTIIDCPTNWNMTFDDYVEVIERRGYTREKAEEEAKDVIENYLYPFEEVIKQYYPHDMPVEEFQDFLKEVGYTEKYEFKDID